MNKLKCKFKCFKQQTGFKIFFLFLFFQLISANNCLSQTKVSLFSKVKPTKEEVVVMKELKKTIKPHKIVVRQESDGFRYFLLAMKNGQMGVYNTTGKNVMPLQMKTIYYSPKTSRGYFSLTCNNMLYEKENYLLYHGDRDASFIAHDFDNNCLIVDLKGQIKSKNQCLNLSVLTGYVIMSAEPLYIRSCLSLDNSQGRFETIHYEEICISGGKNLSLYSSDGTCIVKDIKEIHFRHKNDLNDKMINYYKTIDGIRKAGGLLLDDVNDCVPCSFSKAMYDFTKRCWKIKRTMESDYETYNKDIDYNKSFRDKGEELFEKGNNAEVIEFYANDGIAAPWAKFFTGVSLRHLGVGQVLNLESSIRYLSCPWKGFECTFDLPLAKKQLEMAKTMLETYLEEDTIYNESAKSSLLVVNMYLRELPQKEQAYQKALNDLKERKEQERLAKIQQEREIQLRKKEQSTQIMMAILGGFAKALLSGGNNSQQTYRNSCTVSSGSVSSGNSSSNNDKYRQEWLQRKRNAEKQLNYYQEQLKKNPNNAALKHNIRKQQEIIRNAESML